MRNNKGSAMLFTIILLGLILIVGLASFSLFHHLYLENIDRQEVFKERLERERLAQDVYTEIIDLQPETPANVITALGTSHPTVTVVYDTGIYTITFTGFEFTIDDDIDDNSTLDFTITSWKHTG